MDELLKDLHYSLRTFLRSPGFTLTAVAALALGIGANTAIFSVINTVLLKPLNFPDPDRLVTMMNVSPEGSGAGASQAKFNIWRQQTSVVQDLAAYRNGTVNLTGNDKPEQVPSLQVSESYFRLFGITPILGRSFTKEEDLPKGGNVVIIANGLWKRRYASDPNIVGKTIYISGDAFDVVGVLGPNADKSLDPVPDVVQPFQIDPQSTEQGHYFQATGRLKPGISLAQANAQMKLAAAEFNRKYPNVLNTKNTFGVELLQALQVREVRPSLLILAGAVMFVLLIACANVANLLLVRASTRRREIAIRVAVGAGRGRIIRQLLTESIVLALVSGVVGLGLGTLGIKALLAASPGNIPRIGADGAAVELDWRVLLFTFGVALLTGVLFGLIPALESARTDLNSSLKETSGRSGSGFRQNKARSLLVVIETALALVLLIGSALLIRTFVALRSVKPGYDTHNVLTMRMSLSGDKYLKTAGVQAVLRDGLERLRAVPGVEFASATCCTPLEGAYGLPFIISGRPLTDGPYHGGGAWQTISPGFFDVFKIPVLKGRAFNDRDDAAGPPVVLINESMVKKFWKDSDPLRDQIVIGRNVIVGFNDPPRQIIGVVGDVRDQGLNRDPEPTMYIPNAQMDDAINALNVRLTPVAWVVRTRAEPHSVSAAVQEELRQASGGLPVARIRTMEEIVVRSTAREDFNMLLLTIFGCSALVLAAIGIYGLMAYTVQQRTQEIGIRMALGAESGALRNMVVGQGLVLAIAGIVIGLGAAYGLTRLLTTILFQVKPLDPMTFTAVPVILTAVALLAIWFPATRATKIDPVTALRCE
jgi:putative ABC transport system permease protein